MCSLKEERLSEKKFLGLHISVFYYWSLWAIMKLIL